MRSRAVTFTLQSFFTRSRTFGRNRFATLALSIGALRALAGLFGRPAFGGRAQVYSRASRFGKSDCNRLLCGPGSVLTLTNMAHFLTDKFACLRAGRFSLARIG